VRREGEWRVALMTGLAGAALVLGPGCGLLGRLGRAGAHQPPPEDQVETPKPRTMIVGQVASVHQADRFVLIKRHGPGAFGPDMLYSAVNPDGTSASLRPTGEKLGRFHAADILEGTPSAGDLVIARQMPPEALPRSSPVPQPGPIGGPKPVPADFSGP